MSKQFEKLIDDIFGNKKAPAPTGVPLYLKPAIPMGKDVGRLPGDRITSEFGDRIHPITKKPSNHKGLDWGGRLGDPIYAIYDGVVITAKSSASAGLMVVIRHEGGLLSRYFHMSKLLVQSGMKVVRGQQIGAMGKTGASTGVHLHLEVAVLQPNGKFIERRPTNAEIYTATGFSGAKNV